MENTNAAWLGRLDVGGTRYLHVDLHAVAGERLRQLPTVLRLLLENVVRHMQGAERDAAVQAILAWTATGTSEAEIAYQPGRVLMHDTTSTPALVDTAGMRDALAEAGVDPALLNPSVPVDVSVDHSLAVEAYARPGAAEDNLRTEIRRNAERYRFLRWAGAALQGVRLYPPGTGIMHTINLEQLATVVTTERRGSRQGDEQGDEVWAVPDMMIGTDSHTPMVNGIGVLGWGVGGLEAQTVMFGMPTMLRIPDVVGVRLTNALRPGVQATDLALTATQRLRAIGVSGEFVEYFGPGVATLDAGTRAVVANMAPEYGASTGYFAPDDSTLAYLRATGRGEAHIALVEALCKKAGLWFDPAAEPRYTRVIEIDLAAIGMHIAGPRRPQDLLDYGDSGTALAQVGFTPRAAATSPTTAAPTTAPSAQPLPTHPVALAAITSCTNTSDPRLLVTAALLARKARTLGLRVPPWVKTSLAPGSPAAVSYLRRAGLLDDLEAVGFGIVGFGCTTCIGNSGPLTDSVRAAQQAGSSLGVAILSGNRNFPGRVHPDIELSFIMSPALVIAFALAGDAARDLRHQPVQHTPAGRAVRLEELLPGHDEVEAHLRLAHDAADYGRDFALASRNPLWFGIQAPDTPRFPWDAASTALRRPPFAAIEQPSPLGRYTAWPLMVLGDDITTDHISPASAIPPDSRVADYLVERGDDRNDLNVFASRRGNWEVMVRGAFHSKTLRNLLAPGAPIAHTLHQPSGEVLPIWDVAQRYQQAGEPVVLLAGERYGTGSSRDWAAKGQRLLGIRAVLAPSFERIHRSNLIGMGVLPVRLPAGQGPGTLGIQPGDRIEVDAPAEALAPRCAVGVRIHRADGRVETLACTAAVETQLEVELLRVGGVLPAILRRTLAQAAHTRPALAPA